MKCGAGAARFNRAIYPLSLVWSMPALKSNSNGVFRTVANEIPIAAMAVCLLIPEEVPILRIRYSLRLILSKAIRVYGYTAIQL